VEDLDAAVLGDEHVTGLEIAMHDAAVVCGRERLRDLHGVVDRLAYWQRGAAEPVPQRRSVEQLGHEIERAIVYADIEDGQNSRMVQRARGAGLLLEAAPAIWILTDLRRQHLDRDISTQPFVTCAIHLAHSASADRRNDLVVVELGPRYDRHERPDQRIVFRSRRR